VCQGYVSTVMYQKGRLQPAPEYFHQHRHDHPGEQNDERRRSRAFRTQAVPHERFSSQKTACSPPNPRMVTRAIFQRGETPAGGVNQIPCRLQTVRRFLLPKRLGLLHHPRWMSDSCQPEGARTCRIGRSPRTPVGRAGADHVDTMWREGEAAPVIHDATPRTPSLVLPNQPVTMTSTVRFHWQDFPYPVLGLMKSAG